MLIPLLLTGVGGQIDFLRGAALSQDGLGKPILAMPSVTDKGVSKITPLLKTGQYQQFSDVTTELSDTHR